ncbi:hypothetical protein TTHERM_00753660 (macronuclear) [Tetrahymena thermophila SB210]|uniref:Uncharacterized protein n=1 Tax=Tetrahymena thermophila (strain SB210) TaxID=312017 RepID=Q23NF8_TETTS|nr:hypothetical protein TTHERM_00753660 [Tetrahymena thermophila SB210]EAR98116.2 hypothetical protein TTHERM_00753660 [Tetrahymena thermophila SB210]|eukprot:XP_001018361.2 hypothetical protein TTHERM_00753660 [Tetrahymena thermophila SB210]
MSSLNQKFLIDIYFLQHIKIQKQINTEIIINKQMRIISFVVFTLISLCMIKADFTQQKEEVVQCLMSMSTYDPCQNEDKLCEGEKIKTYGCIQTCISNGAGEPFSVMKDCIQQNCSSNNQSIKIIISRSIQCLLSQALKSALVLLFVLIFF